MTCSRAGATAAINLARAASGLPRDRVTVIYDLLHAEGEHSPNPTLSEYLDWQERQQGLLHRADLTALRKDAIRRHLERAEQDPIPDGATFYAWRHLEARARYDRVVATAAGAVDLDPPGTHDYPLGPDGRPTYVWYATYGSNLHENRLMAYIAGGKPAGANRTYAGCDDKTPPLASAPIRVAGQRPHFALTSRVWGGGIAFLDEQEGHTFLGRAYLISTKQYDQIVAQENGLPAKGAPPVDINKTLAAGRHRTGPGSYETLVHLGDHRGAPVLTFTAPFTVSDALTGTGTVRGAAGMTSTTSNKPSPAYCHMIGQGLHETFGLSPVAQADYIRGCPGGDKWDRQDLVQVLRRSTPPPRSTATTRPWTSRRAVGEVYPPTKTYTSVEEQKAGVRRWKDTVRKAQRNLEAETAAYRTITQNAATTPRRAISDQAAAVADARKALKEAESKRDKAIEQKPRRHFNRAARSRAQWRALASDLEVDIDKTRERLAQTKPDTRAHRRLTGRLANLRDQADEAHDYATPAFSSTADDPSVWT